MSTDSVEQLRVLMARYRLSRRDVATLAGVSEKTVEAWFAGPTAKSRRRIRGPVLELLRLKLSRGD